MFVSGCAHQGGYARSERGSGEGYYSSSDSPTVLEHDPGYYEGRSDRSWGGKVDDSTRSRDVDMADQNENRRLRSEMNSAESDFYAGQRIHADSATRGGSNQAHGWDASGNPPEYSTGSMDSRVRGNSSLRGGSNDARGQGWSIQSRTAVEPSDGISDHRAKADSSIRGGSMDARGIGRNYHSSNWQSQNTSDYSSDRFPSRMENDDSYAYFESFTEPILITNMTPFVVIEENSGLGIDDSSDNANSGSSGSVESGISHETSPGASLTQADSVRSSDIPADPSQDSSFEEPFREPLASDSSLQLGQKDQSPVIEQTEPSSSTAASTESSDLSAAGAPGQFQSESSSSSSTTSSSDTESYGKSSDVTSDKSLLNPDPFNNELGSPDRGASQVGEPNWRFKFNPAQGIGSPAPAGQSGFGSSGSATMNDDQLAQRVKRQLAKDSTGTFDTLKKDIARNITVTSDHGRVTLKGSVPSEQEKKVIGIRAGEIEGVNSVDNQLSVSSDSVPEHRDLLNGSHDLEERHNEIQP